MALVINSHVADHFAEVTAFALHIGKAEQLTEKLDYLANYSKDYKTQCLMFFDYSAHSLAFTMERWDEETQSWGFWWNGGLIYRSDNQTWGVHS